MKAPFWSILASTVIACASAPQPRQTPIEPAAAAVTEKPAVAVPEPAPAPVVTEAPAVVAEPAPAAEPAPVVQVPAGPASKADCEKMMTHIDNLYFESLGDAASFSAPSLHPGWTNSRVRACADKVDAVTRDCVLAAKNIKAAKACGGKFVAETMTAYRVR